MQDRVWRTADGRLILVSQMSSRHIANCVARIRRLRWRLQYLDRMVLELEIRGLGLRDDPGDHY